MANNCFYTMRVKGMFEADITDEQENSDGSFTIEVSGDCAWSIESCCRASGYSEGVDLLAVNSKELDLVIECFSEESGNRFQEHYLYDHGECRIDACVDWNQYYYDENEYESFEDFKKDYDLPEDLTEDDLDDGGYCSFGGFPDYCEFSI